MKCKQSKHADDKFPFCHKWIFRNNFSLLVPVYLFSEASMAHLYNFTLPSHSHSPRHSYVNKTENCVSSTAGLQRRWAYISVVVLIDGWFYEFALIISLKSLKRRFSSVIDAKISAFLARGKKSKRNSLIHFRFARAFAMLQLAEPAEEFYVHTHWQLANKFLAFTLYYGPAGSLRGGEGRHTTNIIKISSNYRISHWIFK